MSPPAEDAIGLYIHWPFCRSKCPYCDFNSHVRDRVDEARWRQALLRELDHHAARTGGRRLASIFFGGGTPSLMAPATVAALLERAHDHWAWEPDIEITLEANPGSVETGRFRELRAAGVSRVSIGVQSLNSADLVRLGRGHDREEAVAAVRAADKIFGRYNFDLIYARPDQSPEAWLAELDEALALAGDHLSLYQLTIEPGTAFHTRYARGELVIPDGEAAGELYERTQDRMERAGLPAYEISAHARPGAESRHNLIYWRYGEYAGVGPGAHGRLVLPAMEGGAVRHALQQRRAPETWLEHVEQSGHATEAATALTREERLDEMTMMGLRLTEGIALPRMRAEFGCGPEQLYDARALGDLVEGGFIRLDADSFAATAAGRQRLNAVLGKLLG